MHSQGWKGRATEPSSPLWAFFFQLLIWKYFYLLFNPLLFDVTSRDKYMVIGRLAILYLAIFLASYHLVYDWRTVVLRFLPLVSRANEWILIEWAVRDHRAGISKYFVAAWAKYESLLPTTQDWEEAWWDPEVAAGVKAVVDLEAGQARTTVMIVSAAEEVVTAVTEHQWEDEVQNPICFFFLYIYI